MTSVLKKFDNWLKKPFIYREEVDFKIVISFILGFAVFLILYILKPFGFHLLKNNLLHYFAGYGVITTCALLFLYFVINPMFPKCFASEKWTVKKEIILVIVMVFVVGFIAWIYHNIVAISDMETSYEHTYLQFLKYTASIGVFPTIIYVYLAEMFLTKNQQNKTKKLKEFISLKNLKNNKELNTVTIQSSNKNNSIVLNVNDLVYVNSEGNYASFFINKDDAKKLGEEILRVQLQAIEKELAKYKQFIRCHKSYIVNTNYINDITGNARGLTIHLSVSDTLIPVSRKFKKQQLMSLIS